MHLWQDIRHGLRLFLKSPGFTLVAVVSIALGTGANVAMFSTADALLLRPIPVRDPGGLVTVGSLEPDTVLAIVLASYPEFVDIRERTRTLRDVTAFYTRRSGVARTTAAPQQMRLVTTVSGNFFEAMGIPMTLGRGFLPEEDRVPGRDPVTVIDHGLWSNLFARDPEVVGKTLVIGQVTYTIVGVTGESFTGVDGLAAEAAYVPLAMWRALEGSSHVDPMTTRDFRVLFVKGRPRAGVRFDEVSAELAVMGRQFAAEHPATSAGRRFIAQTEFQARMSRGPVVSRLILVLSILALAVLAVACANVAGLLASRAPLRARELGLRLAIGAGRGRLVTQLLTESLTIALAGAAGGVLVGYAGISVIRQIEFPTEIFSLPAIELNQRVLVFSLVLSTLSAVLFGLGPALTSTRIDLTQALRVSDPGGRRRWRPTGRNTLVAIQVALSLAVLTIATITYQTFAESFNRGPGFRTTQMAKIEIDAAQTGYAGPRAVALFNGLTAATREIPGVVSSTVTSAMPLWMFENAPLEDPEARVEGEWTAAPLANVVDEHYLTTMGIPLVKGRDFRPTDAAGAPKVTIVNETMARRYWPGDEAIGKRLTFPGEDGGPVEVIGVARDSMYLYPAETPQKMMYLPLRQHPRGVMVLLAQTAGESAAPLAAMRDVIRRTDASLLAYDAHTIERFYDALAVSIGQVVLSLVAGIGLMGVVITVVGLYGLVSYSVNRRTREIGIRVAVGATYLRLMRLLLRQGLTPAWIGMAAGLVLSVAMVLVLRAAAPFTPTYDGWAIVALLPSLFVVTLVAAFIPARRAATVNPVVALREE